MPVARSCFNAAAVPWTRKGRSDWARVTRSGGEDPGRRRLGNASPCVAIALVSLVVIVVGLGTVVGALRPAWSCRHLTPSGGLERPVSSTKSALPMWPPAGLVGVAQRWFHMGSSDFLCWNVVANLPTALAGDPCPGERAVSVSWSRLGLSSGWSRCSLLVTLALARVLSRASASATRGSARLLWHR